MELPCPPITPARVPLAAVRPKPGSRTPTPPRPCAANVTTGLCSTPGRPLDARWTTRSRATTPGYRGRVPRDVRPASGGITGPTWRPCRPRNASRGRRRMKPSLPHGAAASVGPVRSGLRAEAEPPPLSRGSGVRRGLSAGVPASPPIPGSPPWPRHPATSRGGQTLAVGGGLQGRFPRASAHLRLDHVGSRRVRRDLARWLGHSSPAITLGYYAHFMPEAGSKGRGTIDGLLGERGGSAC
jgi:hypothetical protein